MAMTSPRASVSFHAPRLLDRGLAIGGDPDRWRALEDGLEAFCGALRRAPVDDSDEDAATRAYIDRLAAGALEPREQDDERNRRNNVEREPQWARKPPV